ncbi:replicative DNA helicase [Motiliproteus coralliicola]|uniref:Replicative DNA helicase n=1 Tax=Motiliproteus coralliicola TaxID=2283196 RepID=A0A369WWX2_9GAMM|nr:replicative DNA helicase [Motiliproteus coralliicola]RDE25034.1 replicative DNA helicase [Motiliproteus coralliicola]
MSDTAELDSALQQAKIPPHSTEAEQSVLGGLMLDDRVWDAVNEIIVADDFYRPEHRVIFRTMEKLFKAEQPIDVVTLSEELDRHKAQDQAGGLDYLIDLAKNTPSTSNVRAYAEIVKERATLRRLIGIANEIADSAFNTEGRVSGDILDEAERKVLKIAEGREADGGPRSVNPLLESALDRIDELFNAGTTMTGVSTGFTDLDGMTSGLQRSDLVIVAARPSMGKTTFAMNLVENALMGQEKPVLVFSLEMPAEGLVTRMLASLGRIDQTRVRDGKLEEDDWPKLTTAVNMLKDKPLYIDDTSGVSPSEMRSRARRIYRDHGSMGMIMVDYLQLMSLKGQVESRTQEISEISRSLKALAKEMECPVIALSQLNRTLENRPNKRPVNSDLRESGAIEQDADVIMFIYRDEVYNEDSEAKGQAEIIIGKQRNGPIGTCRLAFIGKHSKFQDLAPDHYQDYG